MLHLNARNYCRKLRRLSAPSKVVQKLIGLNIGTVVFLREGVGNIILILNIFGLGRNKIFLSSYPSNIIDSGKPKILILITPCISLTWALPNYFSLSSPLYGIGHTNIQISYIRVVKEGDRQVASKVGTGAVIESGHKKIDNHSR